MTVSQKRIFVGWTACVAVLCAACGIACGQPGSVRFIGKSRYLNGARAVVTHSIDDSNPLVPALVDAMDRHGIKATIFVSTAKSPINDLWPRLRKAVADGHEIGAHSRQHRCSWPDTEEFCRQAYSDNEVAGSRDDILKNSGQHHVWAWAYPCGNCAGHRFVRDTLRAAGYLVARTYPDEEREGHLLPDLQTWAEDPYAAAYTQVAQRAGGLSKSGRTAVAELNAKFDEVYGKDGICHVMSHPQWVDLGPDGFYERHLAHIGGRSDVWYVPLGPLYAFKTIREATEVRPLGKAGFRVTDALDPKIYDGSVTLEFAGSAFRSVLSNGRPITEIQSGGADRWTGEYWRRQGERIWVTVRPSTVVEFR